MESVPSLLPKGLSYLLYKDKNRGKVILEIFKPQGYYTRPVKCKLTTAGGQRKKS